jgi:protein SCO1/2
VTPFPPLARTGRRDALRLLAAGALVLSPTMAVRAAASAPASAAGPLPGDSLWQLPVDLVDQDGHPFRLASLRGTPVIASMFYSSCEMVCPLIFETIRMTLKQAGPQVAARTRVLMVSFDPKRDTVPVLKQTAADRHCDARWTLARGTEDAARQVAAVMGIQFRRLPGGSFNHSSQVDLLDVDGRVVERTGKLGEVDPAFLQHLQKLAGV